MSNIAPRWGAWTCWSRWSINIRPLRGQKALPVSEHRAPLGRLDLLAALVYKHPPPTGANAPYWGKRSLLANAPYGQTLPTGKRSLLGQTPPTGKRSLNGQRPRRGRMFIVTRPERQGRAPAGRDAKVRQAARASAVNYRANALIPQRAFRPRTSTWTNGPCATLFS
jgi:hypothetical protein